MPQRSRPADTSTDHQPPADEAPRKQPAAVDPVTHDEAVAAVAVQGDDPTDAHLPGLDLSSWGDSDLTDALNARGLPTDGDRAVLAARLEQAVLAAPPADPAG